ARPAAGRQGREEPLRLSRRKLLVPVHDRDREVRPQAIRPALHTARLRADGAVQGAGQANHDAFRAVLGHERRDPREVALWPATLEHQQRRCQPALGVAHRHADAPLADVEAQRPAHRTPAYSEPTASRRRRKARGAQLGHISMATGAPSPPGAASARRASSRVAPRNRAASVAASITRAMRPRTPTRYSAVPPSSPRYSGTVRSAGPASGRKPAGRLAAHAASASSLKAAFA